MTPKASGDELKQTKTVEFITKLLNQSFVGMGEPGERPSGRARGFLRKIMEHFGAEGIVFWRLEGPEYKGELVPYQRLVSGVSFFRKREGKIDRLEIRDLPLNTTSSGAAFAEKRMVFGRDGEPVGSPHRLPHPFYGSSFFAERQVKWLMAMPVSSPETDVYGVLSLYWRDDQSQEALGMDQSLFQVAATLWPGVYQRIRESRRLQLITAVDAILGETHSTISVQGETLTPVEPDQADNIMREICAEVGKLLHAEEVSIFLTPLDSSEQIWSCRATNWPELPKRIFSPNDLPGITGWCLANKKSIYIPDLHSFDQDKPWLNTLFSGTLEAVRWEDDLGLKTRDSKSGAGEKPVRSFLAAPLIVEGKLMGLIRCASRANSPLIYFSNPDRRSIETIGIRIAQIWRNWKIAHAKDREAEAWRSFNERSRAIPEKLSEMMKDQATPDFNLLAKAMLSACDKSLNRWGHCERLNSESPSGSGDDDRKVYNDHFIGFHEKYVGASEISPAKGILEMADRQLSVYQTVCKLVELDRQSTNVLNRALSDLRHQIVNPLNKALLRARRHLRDFGHLSHVGDAVYPIRGLLRKSVNVADAFHMLVELEKSGRLKINSVPLDPKKLYVQLTEVARDARLDLDRNRNLSLHLNENLKLSQIMGADIETVYATPRKDLRIDIKLIEQVLYSVIENAIKYSNANNAIILDVELNARGLFFEFTNRGARLTPEEAPLVTVRNWRSETAKRYVGEGTGIGLYLVKAIADAHGGTFLMIPTNEHGYTRAIFSIPSYNETYENRSS